MINKIDSDKLIQKPIFFVSLILSRALGLEKILPNFHIITLNKDPLINILRKNGVSIFCLEEIDSVSKPKNTYELILNYHVKDFIKEQSNNEKSNILTFKSLPQIAHLCKQEKYNYLQANPLIARDLEDKVLFHKLLIKNGIEIIPSQIKPLESCLWEGEKMILQLRRGFAGNSTFLIENRQELERYKKNYGKHQVKLSKFIAGTTITVNGCITEHGPIFGHFFYQIDGEKDLNSNILGTVGNSHFTDNIHKKIKDKIQNIIAKMSEVIFQTGYRGFYGLDLRLSDTGEIYPIECNPRLTASVGNYTEMQIKNNITPMLFIHIMHFLDKKILFKEKNTYQDLNYSFLVFRNTLNKRIKINHNLIPGIYSYSNNKLSFVKSDINFSSCKENEYLLLPAENDTNIDINKEYLYLITKDRLYERNSLNNKSKSIINLIKKEILG